jgi:putative cardiolipin synthase
MNHRDRPPPTRIGSTPLSSAMELDLLPFQRYRLFLARMSVLLCAALLAACATRPPASHFVRTPSHAIATSEVTELSQALTDDEKAHPDFSGFKLLRTGNEALQTRLALAASANKTLDLQYYSVTEDNSGKLILEALLRAADRGVRVRLLVDDLNYKDVDLSLAALNAHPNIEVRIFNPFSTRNQNIFESFGNLFTELDTLDKRMHNKAMIADNQVMIVGGRNLSDEYFGTGDSLSFRDLDVLVAGPLTAHVSSSFDTFWSSDQSYPLRALSKQKFEADKLSSAREELRKHWSEMSDITEAPLVSGPPLPQLIATHALPMVWAPAQLWVDTPQKVDENDPNYQSPPSVRLLKAASQAQTELLIVSPYFVPAGNDVQLLTAGVARGAHVDVLTNSLAATDAVAVHAGYVRYRVAMLQAGVNLYEFKAIHDTPGARLENEEKSQGNGILGSQSRASLHAKVYEIDRQLLIIGSMNLDPRSRNLNTELLVVIHSPELATQASELFARALNPTQSYHVMLAPVPGGINPMSSTSLVWISQEDGKVVEYHHEPGADLWRRVVTGIFFVLPVENEL